MAKRKSVPSKPAAKKAAAPADNAANAVVSNTGENTPANEPLKDGESVVEASGYRRGTFMNDNGFKQTNH